jgi:hypothetical protein
MDSSTTVHGAVGKYPPGRRQNPFPYLLPRLSLSFCQPESLYTPRNIHVPQSDLGAKKHEDGKRFLCVVLFFI